MIVDGLGGLDGASLLRLGLLVRLATAALLGGIIGLEREISDKPAGFRTNMLICVGAALLTDLSISIAGAADPMRFNADPARIAAQIVSGVGFLGAGSIIRSRGSVRGLTTAATIWVVAAIGMAAGAGAFIEAVGTTILVLAVLVLLGRVEGRIFRPFERDVRILIDPQAVVLAEIERLFLDAGYTLETLDVEMQPTTVATSFHVSGPRRRWAGLLGDLTATPGIQRITLS